ncbi:MAG: FkbM family methyltransferase [Bacteroidota bacterium]
MKKRIKQIIKKLPIAFTKNQQYDQQTKAVIKRCLRSDSNCVDVGCHEGEVLELMLQYAPQGQHFGFEPIPDFFKKLKSKFPPNCHFYQLGLSNQKGVSTFNYVVSNPSYSGLKKRKYDKPNEKDTTLTVETDLMDHVISDEVKIDFIKIDVEGAEYLVLSGAKNIIKKHRPIIVFEHGLGGADVYGVRPHQVFELLHEACGLKISTMKRWLKGKAPFSKAEFVEQFDKKLNYYFIAYP